MKNFQFEARSDMGYETHVSISGDTEIDTLCYPGFFHEYDDIFKVKTSLILTKIESRILYSMIQLSAIHNGVDVLLNSSELLDNLLPEKMGHDFEAEKVLSAFNLFVVTACDYLQLHSYNNSGYLYKYSAYFVPDVQN